MPVTTSQQIIRYYERFSQTEITFTKEVIRATNLNTRHVYLKCQGDQWPCIIYAASMTGARILTSSSASLTDSVRKANSLVQLRFSFLEPEKSDPITFFVPARMSTSGPYGDQKELLFSTLLYTQRPPDDLIQVIGQLLEANANATRRREERIALTPHSVNQLRLEQGDCSVVVDGVAHKGIFRDLSFSGCKVILMGDSEALRGKPVVVRLVFDDPPERFELAGSICRCDPVEGRNDVGAFGVHFDEEATPVGYRLRINAVLKQFRSKASADE